MPCPFCGAEDTRVIDTRQVGDAIRRRRECQSCHQRFTTYERVARASIMVVKRDGRREEFDREKLYEGLRRACAKRPISTEVLGQIVDQIENRLCNLGQAEVPSRVIGEMVMERLKDLDGVAYVRFASVYRCFTDLEDLKREVDGLLSSGQS